MTADVIVAVEVGVALSRPPRLDRLSRVLVEVEFDPITGPGWFSAETEARLVACWMATRPDVVMPVSATVVDILEV